ncbi:hypothetical protein ABMY26_06250 (plasmid) [Azospirillum sp. HJ39]|uniref:hypothetical protein n=1 Tax=Azospirillum sp. HJ39 TaxID=3159496 RepID=UPI003557BFC9
MIRTNKKRVSFDDLASRRGLAVMDLIGLEMTLEYTDAENNKSTRQVRVLHFQGDTLLCRCHWRRAERSFRIDRISSVIDKDGEVLSAADFFRLFGVAIAAPSLIQTPYNDSQTVNSAASRGFSALAAVETRLSNDGAKRHQSRPTKVQIAALVILLLLIIALAI